MPVSIKQQRFLNGSDKDTVLKGLHEVIEKLHFDSDKMNVTINWNTISMEVEPIFIEYNTMMGAQAIREYRYPSLTVSVEAEWRTE